MNTILENDIRDEEISVIRNNNYDGKTPYITVITPIYNRRRTIMRTMSSVERQTLRNIEYIIIDDASTERADDIIIKYMQETKLPVIFIKKKYQGGVHTARNIGYQYARGILILCIDSDDELLPRACEIFFNVWDSIPSEKREEYWQIKAQCIDASKKVITGSLFPNEINELPIKQARKYFSMAKGEQIGCRVAKILKNNCFPEPKGVTFVTENILWMPMELKYRSYGINDVVRIYHTEGDDHLSNKHHRNLQTCRNSLWNAYYFVENSECFKMTFKSYIRNILCYSTMAIILGRADKSFIKQYRIRRLKNKIWIFIFHFPSMFLAVLYKKYRMN